jgi:hypothetical protein
VVHPAHYELRAGILSTVSYSYPMNDPRPRDDRDVAQDTACDLAEIAAHIGQPQGDANAYLTDPNYNTLRLRLEIAHQEIYSKYATNVLPDVTVFTTPND